MSSLHSFLHILLDEFSLGGYGSEWQRRGCHSGQDPLPSIRVGESTVLEGTFITRSFTLKLFRGTRTEDRTVKKFEMVVYSRLGTPEQDGRYPNDTEWWVTSDSRKRTECFGFDIKIGSLVTGLLVCLRQRLFYLSQSLVRLFVVEGQVGRQVLYFRQSTQDIYDGECIGRNTVIGPDNGWSPSIDTKTIIVQKEVTRNYS